DKSGLSIAGTFQRDTRRYKFKNKFEVIDLGLQLEDVEGLEHEPHSDKGSREARASNMRENGADGATIEFLLDRRVELNAMPSDRLGAFVEHKLTQHGATKVVPTDDDPAAAYALQMRNLQVEEIIRRELERAAGISVKAPDDLSERVNTAPRESASL